MLEAEDGTVLAAHGEAIGVATNNVAKYSALIAGLEKAIELCVDELEVVSDSELMVKQMRGEYKVKNEALRELSVRASRLARELEVVSDSELMVKQMRGEYKVKNEALRELSLRAAGLARELGTVTYTAVRREHNQLADQLVNEALDGAE